MHIIVAKLQVELELHLELSSGFNLKMPFQCHWQWASSGVQLQAEALESLQVCSTTSSSLSITRFEKPDSDSKFQLRHGVKIARPGTLPVSPTRTRSRSAVTVSPTVTTSTSRLQIIVSSVTHWQSPSHCRFKFKWRLPVEHWNVRLGVIMMLPLAP